MNLGKRFPAYSQNHFKCSIYIPPGALSLCANAQAQSALRQLFAFKPNLSLLPRMLLRLSRFGLRFFKLSLKPRRFVAGLSVTRQKRLSARKMKKGAISCGHAP
jgi:hypothetical protein